MLPCSFRITHLSIDRSAVEENGYGCFGVAACRMFCRLRWRSSDADLTFRGDDERALPRFGFEDVGDSAQKGIAPRLAKSEEQNSMVCAGLKAPQSEKS